jgi:hypothetical protein
MIRVATEQVTLSADHPDLAVDPDLPLDPNPAFDLAINPDLTAEDNLDALRKCWPEFLAWVKAAIDHDGFYVF